MVTIALDPGYSSIKLVGVKGSETMQSAVSICQGDSVGHMAGLRRSRRPLKIGISAGTFYVGDSAHGWGRPIENLDLDRLSGSPEMDALFLGALSQYGVPEEPIRLIVGLPIASLMGEQATATQRQVRRFLKGAHRWQENSTNREAEVEDVQVTSQPVGAMFDYLLDNEGHMSPAKRQVFREEIGVCCIGLNTVELLVVQAGAPVHRFLGGRAVGVRRLLELLNGNGLYSLAELDAQLRSRSLDLTTAQPIWQREVMGFVEHQWGTAYRRFACIVTVGGGAMLLRDAMLAKFREKAFLPEDPVLATARGLYKYGLMKARRRKSRGQDR